MQYTLLKNINLDNTFELDRSQLKTLTETGGKNISLSLPIQRVPKTLNLTKVNIVSDNFNIISTSGDVCGIDLGQHYRGKLDGDDSSIVSISFFNDQIHGHIISSEGTFDINHHGDMIFSTDLVGEQPQYDCGTSHDSDVNIPKYTSEKPKIKQNLESQINAKTINPYITEVATKLVRLDWEIEYDIFQVYGTTTWCRILALFNASATLFANDGIQVVLSTLYGWDSFASPYINYYTTIVPGTSVNGLAFINRNYRKYWGDGNIPPNAQPWQFQGDLHHLLAISYPFSSGAGGVSDGLGTLCNTISTSTTSGATSSPVVFSQLFSSQITNTPSSSVYTWNVNVVTHEQGHAFDSPHTFGCYWNVTNWTPGGEPVGCERIDTCRFENSTYFGCNTALCIDNGYPVNGGTIMSYCHQIGGVGINFANGFGPQPQQRIVNFINGETCLCPTIQRDIDFTFNVVGNTIEIVNINTVYPRMWVWDGMVSETAFINELSQGGGVGNFLPNSFFTSGKIGLSFEWPLNCEVCFDLNTLLPEPCFNVCDNVTPTQTPTTTQTPTVTPTKTKTPTVTPTKTQTPTNTKTQNAPPNPSNSPTQTPTVSPTVTPTKTPTSSNTQTPTVTPTTCCSKFRLDSSPSDINGTTFLVTLCGGGTQSVNVPTGTFIDINCANNVSIISGLGTYIRYPGCICVTPTPTNTPIIPQLRVLLLYGFDIYQYQVLTNTQTYLTTLTFDDFPFFETNDISHTSSKIFVKGYAGIDFDDPNLICAIGEWDYTLSPFSITFVRYIVLPDPIGEYPGLFALNNTTLITSTDTNTIPNGIVQIDISGPTPSFTTLLQFPINYRTFGDYVVTTNGKLIVVVVDFDSKDKYIYQYNFNNLSSGPEITKFLGDVLSERFLFEDNGSLYFLTNSSPSELYNVGLVPPYDITLINTLTFDFYSGASNTYSNSTVDLIPGGPSLTPTQTPTITPTPQPTNVGCAQCINLHPCAISKFFVSCCEPFDTIRIYLIPYQVANSLVNGQSYFVEAVGFSNCAVYDENLNTANFSFEYINITPQ